jgi:RecA/RadA recombinase
MSYLKAFRKSVSKMDTVAIGVRTVSEWLSSGNYALNYSLTGDWNKFVPMGRSTALVGPSGSGKSFLATSAIREAQRKGWHVLLLDSENALDVEYLTKIGVKTDEESMTYVKVTMIEDVNKVLSEFFGEYVKQFGTNNYEADRVLIVIDSLAMLSSTTEIENYERDGTVKGDQGQLAKRRKAMMKMLHGKIAMLPMGLVFTDHVYPQDVMMGDGAWAMTNSIKFFPSITGLATKLKLKEGTDVVGIRMRVETYKSRFAKSGSKVELEVPYATGLSPFSGFVELGESLGIFAKGTQPGEKLSYVCDIIDQSTGEILDHIVFKDKDLTHEMVARILKHPKATPVIHTEKMDEDIAAILEGDEE